MADDKDIERIRKARETTDMKRLIRLALDSPLEDGMVFEVDGSKPLKYYKSRNTDVKTRMILQVAIDAAKGDLKSAEFLMKYGGFEPPKEQNVTVELPTIIDDITAKAMVRQEAAAPRAKGEDSEN